MALAATPGLLLPSCRRSSTWRGEALRLRSGGRWPSRPRRLVQVFVWVTQLGWLGQVEGQIYDLRDVPVPANRSLHSLYAYYIFSDEDAPERRYGPPSIRFLRLHAHGQAEAVLKDYRGVQISLMKYDEKLSLIDPNHYCCTKEDVSSQTCLEQDVLLFNSKSGEKNRPPVYMHTIRTADADRGEDTSNPIRVLETGVYLLTLSNCGDYHGAAAAAFVSGSVMVRNPYGFLPGNEYYKMPFYGWLALVYMALAAVWTFLSLRWWRELFSMQSCITGVILLGLIESFLWYCFFTDWNTGGVRGNVLFVLAILSSVTKSIFSYMLVLVASLGWGVTRPFLDKAVIARIKMLCILYIVLGVAREVGLSYHHSLHLPIAFVLFCLLPVSLLNGATFYWVFSALSSLIQTLTERGQTEKLLVFQRLWIILIVALGIATVTLLYQIALFSHSITSYWTKQWLYTDGISHILFLFVLAAIMYLWAPHKHSQRYTYSAVDTEAPAEAKAPQQEKVESADEAATPTLVGNAKATSSASVLKDTMMELDRLGMDDGQPPAKTE